MPHSAPGRVCVCVCVCVCLCLWINHGCICMQYYARCQFAGHIPVSGVLKEYRAFLEKDRWLFSLIPSSSYKDALSWPGTRKRSRTQQSTKNIRKYGRRAGSLQIQTPSHTCSGSQVMIEVDFSIILILCRSHIFGLNSCWHWGNLTFILFALFLPMRLPLPYFIYYFSVLDVSTMMTIKVILSTCLS